MGLGTKIQWTLKLLRNALHVWSGADWIGVFKEILSSYSKAKSYPEPRLFDRGEEIGLYIVGTFRLFFPLAFNSSFWCFASEEVFVRHVYEYGGYIRPGEWGQTGGLGKGTFSLYALEKGANALPFAELVFAEKAQCGENLYSIWAFR